VSFQIESAFPQHVQVTPLITELGRTRMEVNTKVKAGFSNKLFALNVVITIPVPDTTAHADMQTSIGESPLGYLPRHYALHIRTHLPFRGRWCCFLPKEG